MAPAPTQGSRLRQITGWTAACALVITVLVYFFKSGGIPTLRQKEFDYLRPPASPPLDPIRPGEKVEDNTTATTGWSFDYRRDSNNYGLTATQCADAFPLLYQEVDRAVNYERRSGNVTEKDVEDAWFQNEAVKVLIYENQLHIINAHGVWTDHNRLRSLATLSALNRALASYHGQLPNVEFTIAIRDNPTGHALAYTRLSNQENLWLMPGYGFWSSPSSGLRSYAAFRSIPISRETDFLDKFQKLIWRGAQNISAGARIRNALIKESNGADWSDVKAIDWKNETSVREDFVLMEDHCEYMFAAETGDNGHNGRLKYLLNCNNIVIAHDLNGIEHFHHLLASSGDNQNYVKLRSDFSDLKKVMSSLTEPSFLEDRGRQIADNARRMFRDRYLTPAAEACYWRALIRGWASVQGFTPQLWDDSEESDRFVGGSDYEERSQRRNWRGMPFESYILMEEVEFNLSVENRHICVGSQTTFQKTI